MAYVKRSFLGPVKVNNPPNQDASKGYIIIYYSNFNFHFADD